MYRRIIGLLAVVAILATSITAQDSRERANVPDEYKWDLTHIYPSDEEWRAEKERVSAEIEKLSRFEGTLGKSAGDMLVALNSISDVTKEFVRLYVYAAMQSDVDTRVSKYQAMRQEMQQVAVDFGTRTSFVEPEILKIDKSRIDSFLAAEEGLKVHRQYLDDIIRRKEHTGSEEQEKLIADAGLMTGAPGQIYGIFSNADFPYPEVTLADGNTVTIDKSAYNRYRGSNERADREKVMSTYYGKIGEFSATFGSMMNANNQRDLFIMRVRNYPSTLAASLDGPNVPVDVYHSLIKGVNENIESFHRYLKLRKRILGVDELHYYDLYAPLVASADVDYSVDEARKILDKAFVPLGEDYRSVVRRAFDERWLDLMPNTGKRSGAYSNGAAYDVHPYMLINYNGKYGDVSTLAHELGHTMQSYYSNKNQAYPNAGYPLFIAEVASTFNEALLVNHMLNTVKDDATRLSILGEYLENIKGTVFRQTQFAEFELRTHEMAEKGQPLTGEALDDLYLEITRRYYGHDDNVCVVDDYIKHEWASVPHFYRSFYVFQYATSFTAAEALAAPVLAGNKNATKKYLDFISAGGSDYPIELLRAAGVDMTSSEPLELTMKKMTWIMNEMEKILDRMGK